MAKIVTDFWAKLIPIRKFDADDEAKRIAEMAREERALYPERYAVPDDEAKRIRAEVIEAFTLALMSRLGALGMGENDLEEFANSVKRQTERALAQPEQGGAT